MNKKLLLVFSLLLMFLVGMIRCQDAGGIFEGAEDEDDELVGGSNTIETQPIKEDSATEEKKVDTTKSTTATPSTASFEDDSMDEDEFEGLDNNKEAAKPSTPSAQSTNSKPEVKKPTTAAENVTVRPLTWIDFIPEVITAILIAIYTSYYFMNRKVNESKILKWMEGNKDILLENFTSVKNIVKMSTNEFRIKCTGRLNCIGMEMNFSFKREHDLIYSLMDKFKPVDETVTIEFPVGATGTMPGFNLIMMNKNKIANYKKDNSTISAITNEVSDPKFPNNMNILTETKDLIPLVLSKDTRHTYKKLEKYVENVYINDNHYEQPEFPNFIRFVFRLPPTNEEFRELFLTCFDVLDRAVSLEMPKLVKEKVGKKRLELQKAKLRHEHEKREERSQQIKDEKKKRLLENKDDLSEKELSKLEQKEKKKSMKKANGKMKRVVVG